VFEGEPQECRQRGEEMKTRLSAGVA